jgi:Gluconate 2-dehydrogenase subunit 3
VARWLADDEVVTLRTLCDRLMPGDDEAPSASEAGVVEYVDTLLAAFSFEPPRIWAGGPFSGRQGGEVRFGSFHRLSPRDELAWRTRIEGSLGRAEREVNGPVVGLQERYREGLTSLGRDFADLPPEDQDARMAASGDFVDLVFSHCCEGMYGAPEYGGNRGLGGWRAIRFDGDVQPRGYTDEEVSEP